MPPQYKTHDEGMTESVAPGGASKGGSPVGRGGGESKKA